MDTVPFKYTYKISSICFVSFFECFTIDLATILIITVQHFGSCKDPSTLANWTLIILFSEMLKFSIFYFFFKSKIIVKENSEYFGIFCLLKRMFQN